MQHEAELDLLFHALSDSTRRKILMRVRESDRTVNDIASQFNISLPAVSKHLKVLDRAGLISRRKQGRRRICHAEPRKLRDAAQWLDFYQRFWNERLDNLKRYMEHE